MSRSQIDTGHVLEQLLQLQLQFYSYSTALQLLNSKLTVTYAWRPCASQASDPLFTQIGAAFVKVQKEEYGFDPDGVQHFNGDNFNEMRPSSTDPAYLAGWGHAMYSPLLEGAGSGASWFVQVRPGCGLCGLDTRDRTSILGKAVHPYSPAPVIWGS